MPKDENWEPEGVLRRCSDFSGAALTTSESSFRELDDEFLQAQTRIWLGELLHLRFDFETALPDLLSDGDLLFQVSWVIWRMLVVTFPEMKYLSAYKNVFRPIVYGKIGSRYLPYSNVDAFLKVCQILGLTAVDLFTPSNVVEKGDIRRVCMCIRALSKRARSKSLNVPDFDVVTYTIAMPTYIVGCIRRYWEQSRCSTSISTNSSSSTGTRRYQKKTSDAVHVQQCDLSSEESDDTETSFRALECESPTSDTSHEPISPLDSIQDISAVTTLDDLSSFLAQDMFLSSGKQGEEGHEYASTYSLGTLADSFPEYIIRNVEQVLETSPSSSALLTSDKCLCEIDSNIETACTCLSGIRFPTHDIGKGSRKFDVELASPKTCVGDSSTRQSSVVVASTDSISGKIRHKSGTVNETQNNGYTDDADSCCFQRECGGTCLDLTPVLGCGLEDGVHAESNRCCIIQESYDETYSSLPLKCLESNCNKSNRSSVANIVIHKNQCDCIENKETDESMSNDTKEGISPDAPTNSQKSYTLVDFEVANSSSLKYAAVTSDTYDVSVSSNVSNGTFTTQMARKYENMGCICVPGFAYQKKPDNIYQSGEQMSTHFGEAPPEIGGGAEEWCYCEHDISIYACVCSHPEKSEVLPLSGSNSHERPQNSAVARKDHTNGLCDNTCSANNKNGSEYRDTTEKGDVTEYMVNSLHSSDLNSDMNISADESFLARYLEPCCSRTIQDILGPHSHASHKHSVIRQNDVEEFLAGPRGFRGVVVFDDTPSIEHMISRCMTCEPSKETVMKTNIIQHPDLKHESVPESSSPHPTACSQYSFNSIIDKAGPTVVSLLAPEEPMTRRVSERPTEDDCHSLVNTFQYMKNTNYRSSSFIKVNGQNDLVVATEGTQMPFLFPVACEGIDSVEPYTSRDHEIASLETKGFSRVDTDARAENERRIDSTRRKVVNANKSDIIHINVITENTVGSALESDYSIDNKVANEQMKGEKVTGFSSRSNQYSMLDILQKNRDHNDDGILAFRDASPAYDKFGSQVSLTEECCSYLHSKILKENSISTKHNNIFLEIIEHHPEKSSIKLKVGLSSNSVEKDVTEKNIETNLQIPSGEKVNNNDSCHQDPIMTTSRSVVCSSGEQRTSLEEIIFYNPFDLDDPFDVADVSEFELSVMTDCDVIRKFKKIQVNFPSSFFPVSSSVGSKCKNVLESDCSSLRSHCDSGKADFSTSVFTELDLHCPYHDYAQKLDEIMFNGSIHLPYVDHGFQAMPEVDSLHLDHLIENDVCSKDASLKSEISSEGAEEFHNQPKPDKDQLPENGRNNSSKDTEEASRKHEAFNGEMHRLELERNAEDTAKHRPSRKIQFITVAGGVMFFGAFMFLFKLRSKRSNKYGIGHMLCGVSKTIRPSWTEAKQCSLVTNKDDFVYPGTRLMLTD